MVIVYLNCHVNNCTFFEFNQKSFLERFSCEIDKNYFIFRINENQNFVLKQFNLREIHVSLVKTASRLLPTIKRFINILFDSFN